MKDYIKLLMFFGLLAIIAYIGNQNLSNVLWVLLGIFVGATAFLWMARRGWLEINSVERR